MTSLWELHKRLMKVFMKALWELFESFMRDWWELLWKLYERCSRALWQVDESFYESFMRDLWQVDESVYVSFMRALWEVDESFYELLCLDGFRSMCRQPGALAYWLRKVTWRAAARIEEMYCTASQFWFPLLFLRSCPKGVLSWIIQWTCCKRAAARCTSMRATARHCFALLAFDQCADSHAARLSCWRGVARRAWEPCCL